MLEFLLELTSDLLFNSGITDKPATYFLIGGT
jgi:hypothetical protein